jgi:hypothetical protein
MKRSLIMSLAATCLSSAAFAGQVQYGGIQYGNAGGGEFKFTVTDATGLGGILPNSIITTFCVERNEYVYGVGDVYNATLNTAAVNGGVGGGNPDPISPQTAFLMSAFSGNALVGYDYTLNSAGRNDSASALQAAIWLLENEISQLSDVVGGSVLTLAQSFITAANASGWTTIGNVGVLNLTNANGTPLQDQLVIVPAGTPGVVVPLPAGAIAGLALFGVLAVRQSLVRRRHVAE